MRKFFSHILDNAMTTSENYLNEKYITHYLGERSFESNSYVTIIFFFSRSFTMISSPIQKDFLERKRC